MASVSAGALIRLAPILLNFLWLTDTVQQTQLAPLYWNITGNSFSGVAPIVQQVPLSSSLDIICPYYSNQASVNVASIEYYQVYRVSQASFNACNLYETTENSTPQIVVNCSTPFVLRSATIAFLRYASVPGAIDFQVGQTYYYMSTSSGTLSGLTQTRSGVCNTNKMRVAFQVVDTLPTTGGTPTSAASTTSSYGLTGRTGWPLVSNTSGSSRTAAASVPLLLAVTAFIFALIFQF